MKKNNTHIFRKTSACLQGQSFLANLESAHVTLQVLREEARKDGQRSNAQHYADTQWLILGAIKTERRKLTGGT